jgi:hypothetical protein
MLFATDLLPDVQQFKTEALPTPYIDLASQGQQPNSAFGTGRQASCSSISERARLFPIREVKLGFPITQTGFNRACVDRLGVFNGLSCPPAPFPDFLAFAACLLRLSADGIAGLTLHFVKQHYHGCCKV